MKIQIGQLSSSVARHLGIEKQYQSQLLTPSNKVEAIVGMMFKSTSRFDLSLSLVKSVVGIMRYFHKE